MSDSYSDNSPTKKRKSRSPSSSSLRDEARRGSKGADKEGSMKDTTLFSEMMKNKNTRSMLLVF